MKNIHILPTDKPSKLFNCFGKLEIGDYVTRRENLQVTNQNIYITNDEEIKYGDYRYSLIQNNIVFVTGFTLKVNKEYWKLNNHTHKKIILTTDQDLIKDGVQAIDDEFLEWFVKNLSCEVVKIEKENICARCYCNDPDDCWSAKECSDGKFNKIKYKLIIKKEPKQLNLEDFDNRKKYDL